ncbi:unnamed protein product [Ascophyllum nodosum]
MQHAKSLAVLVALALSMTGSSFVIPCTSRWNFAFRRHKDAPGPQVPFSRLMSRSVQRGASRSGRRHSTNARDVPCSGLRRNTKTFMAKTAKLGKIEPGQGEKSATRVLGSDGIQVEDCSRWSRRVGTVSKDGFDFVTAGGGEGVGVLPSASSQSTATRTEIPTDVAVVGDPQKVVEKEYSIEVILKELAEIQNQGPKNYCVLGTRHCSFLHQQIIELLAYALVLSGNHVFTSGAMGTNAATIRGALRAERKDLLTVVLPQSLEKQSEASRELIQKVKNVVTNPQNDHLPLDAASRLCNSDLLSRTEQLICFAFHDSKTIIETSKEARAHNMIVTELYLD